MGLFDIFRKKEPEKLDIEKTNVIDALASDNSGTKLIMLIIDAMDRSDEHRHLMLLQEKINSYIAYIETKQYAESYPAVTWIEIQVKFLYKETDNCTKLLEVAAKTLRENLPIAVITAEHGNK